MTLCSLDALKMLSPPTLVLQTIITVNFARSEQTKLLALLVPLPLPLRLIDCPLPFLLCLSLSPRLLSLAMSLFAAMGKSVLYCILCGDCCVFCPVSGLSSFFADHMSSFLALVLHITDRCQLAHIPDVIYATNCFCKSTFHTTAPDPSTLTLQTLHMMRTA